MCYIGDYMIKQMTTDEKFMMNKIISENLFNLCRLCNSLFNVPNYQHYAYAF